MGDEPIEKEYAEKMRGLASVLDEIFNGDSRGHDRKVCFALLIANFGESDNGRVNYIGNGERGDVVAMMKEFIARAEGRHSPDVGRA